jgi:hypothetical protein
MTKPIVKIYDVQTDETIEREMTDAEFKQFEKDQSNAQSEKSAAEAKATAKAALLSKLGITAEEAQLLLGGN